jgi:hypothetical protein
MSRLVLYVQENMTTNGGKPYIDFAAFIAFRYNRFELFCTRNPLQRIGTREVSETKPSMGLTFDTLDGVFTFLTSVLDWDTSSISLEFHAVRGYSDVAYDFSGLWGCTGYDTELASFDKENSSRLRDALRTLKAAQVDAVDYIERV